MLRFEGPKADLVNVRKVVLAVQGSCVALSLLELFTLGQEGL